MSACRETPQDTKWELLVSYLHQHTHKHTCDAEWETWQRALMSVFPLIAELAHVCPVYSSWYRMTAYWRVEASERSEQLFFHHNVLLSYLSGFEILCSPQPRGPDSGATYWILKCTQRRVNSFCFSRNKNRSSPGIQMFVQMYFLAQFFVVFYVISKQEAEPAHVSDHAATVSFHAGHQLPVLNMLDSRLQLHFLRSGSDCSSATIKGSKK